VLRVVGAAKKKKKKESLSFRCCFPTQQPQSF